MLKLKVLILFIFFIQVVPNFVDFFEKQIDGLIENKCTEDNRHFLEIETAAQCVERNSFLPKDDNGSKCCSFSGKIDPLFDLKKAYRENWKKIIAQKYGYDLNISEEEIKKKLYEIVKVSNRCQYIMKELNFTLLYSFSLGTIDGIVGYDCGEG